MCLEIIIQSKTGSSGGEFHDEAVAIAQIVVVAAVVVADEGEAEGCRPVLGGHPCDARLYAHSVAEIFA